MSSRLKTTWRDIRENGLLRTMAVFYDLNYFDYKYGIETRAPMQVADLDIRADQKADINKYTCVNWILLRKVLKMLPVDLAQSVFLDIGSGKGKALVIAGQFPFRRLVGVEISPSLVELCRANMRQAGLLDRVELLTVDARLSSAIPIDADVILLFSPFTGAAMDALAENLEASRQLNPRTIHVVYLNHAYCEAFERRGYSRLLSIAPSIFYEYGAMVLRSPA